MITRTLTPDESILVMDCETGKITMDELKLKLIGIGSTLKPYDKRTERNTDYPEGDNNSAIGFRYHAASHPRGVLLHQTLKPAIRKSIGIAHYFVMRGWVSPLAVLSKISRPIKIVHTSIQNKYDKDAYVYDDNRLRFLNDFLKIRVKPIFKDADNINRVIDITLFIMKEDIYYRARLLDMVSGLPKGTPRLIPYMKEYVKDDFHTPHPPYQKYIQDFMNKLIDILDVCIQKDPRFEEIINTMPKFALLQEEKDNIIRWR